MFIFYRGVGKYGCSALLALKKANVDSLFSTKDHSERSGGMSETGIMDNLPTPAFGDTYIEVQPKIVCIRGHTEPPSSNIDL
jgi:hypothetical protein